jgi:hypothetical protein
MKFNSRFSSGLIVLLVIAGFILASYLGVFASESTISGSPGEGSVPSDMGTVKVGGDRFEFDPTHVETVRPDLFNSGYFSTFDALVHVAKQGEIDLQYHFDESMNTHVIDSIDGESDWWYEVYYAGGWSEDNVFRMDHYPWKDRATLEFFEVKRSHLENIYSTFREEVAKKNQNNGKVIIPSVIIKGRSFTEEFENVEVTAHNLRSDALREGTITALDVILSLGDQGKIEYGLQWYESIGSARPVKSYWVEAIDGDKAYGRCGFVYESGSLDFKGFLGSHIHLPSDTRIINSPEYVKFFWICI